MPSNQLTIRQEESIVTATLNRPLQLNALNKNLLDDLQFLIDLLEKDHKVVALIVTGSGERAFCVGADLKERLTMSEKDILNRMEFVHRLYQRLEKAHFVTLAAINGITLGGGLELALACDLRIASDNSQFGFPEVELGIIPGNGGTQRLPRIVGLARALEMILLSKRLTVQQALSQNLVHQMVPVNELQSTVRALAQKLTGAGPIAIRQAKLAIRSGFNEPLERALNLETECYKPCLSSKDRIEGLKAFQEKRRPQYKGI